MIRVLHVLGGVNLGGAESRIMDLYRHMDREQVQFDFLVHMDAAKYAQAVNEGKNPEEYRDSQHYDDEIKSLGGHIYALPKYKVYNIGAYKKAIRRFFEQHNDYSVVQGHMTSTASIYLPIAKECGLKCVIAHTRNAGVDKGLKGVIVKNLRKSLPQKSDFLFACSHLAGDATFGGAKYTYIPNTIDTSRFLFDAEKRKEIRDKHGISDSAIVIGNVARFSPQKNQKYLLDVLALFFDTVSDKVDENTTNVDVRLIFCGDGDLKAECEEYAEKLGLSEKVIFAGNCSDVEKYYSAMDIYAFPSIYEGLPGVVVEAQASGLRCMISDTITREVCLTDTMKVIGITEEDKKVWADTLVQNVAALLNTENLQNDRADAAAQVRAAGFDVNDQADKMMRFYLEPCKENLPSF